MTNQQLARWIDLAEVRMKKAVRGAVLDRIKNRKCLHCDSPKYQRGLCVKHYFQYRGELMALPKSKRTDFELDMIESGKILEANFRPVELDDNPFREKD